MSLFIFSLRKLFCFYRLIFILDRLPLSAKGDEKDSVEKLLAQLNAWCLKHENESEAEGSDAVNSFQVLFDGSQQQTELPVFSSPLSVDGRSSLNDRFA